MLSPPPSSSRNSSRASGPPQKASAPQGGLLRNVPRQPARTSRHQVRTLTFVGRCRSVQSSNSVPHFNGLGKAGPLGQDGAQNGVSPPASYMLGMCTARALLPEATHGSSFPSGDGRTDWSISCWLLYLACETPRVRCLWWGTCTTCWSWCGGVGVVGVMVWTVLCRVCGLSVYTISRTVTTAAARGQAVRNNGSSRSFHNCTDSLVLQAYCAELGVSPLSRKA